MSACHHMVGIGVIIIVVIVVVVVARTVVLILIMTWVRERCAEGPTR